VIKNLIWDVDGTLFDTYPAIVQAYLEAMQSFGHTVPAAEVDAWARVSLGTCTANLAARCGLDKREIAVRFGHLYSTVHAGAQAPFAGVKAVCQAALDAGGLNAIVTHRARESTEELLAVHGMRHLFAEIVAGDDGYPKKPDPAAFLAIIARCGLDPAETAAVGDREIDAQAAKAAGLFTCWFHGRPAEVQPDLVFTDYGELVRRLGLGRVG
jgi:HAD superfamily hydrolase (TIGR01509 family)